MKSKKTGIKAYDIYGLRKLPDRVSVTNVNASMVRTWMKTIISEIIDPNTLQPVEPGQTGELVFTHLTQRGNAIARYRTRDLTALHRDKCSWGVHWYAWIVSLDVVMICWLSVVSNVFPTQLNPSFLKWKNLNPLFVDSGTWNNTDTMELQVEVRPDFYLDEINKCWLWRRNWDVSSVPWTGSQRETGRASQHWTQRRQSKRDW